MKIEECSPTDAEYALISIKDFLKLNDENGAIHYTAFKAVDKTVVVDDSSCKNLFCNNLFGRYCWLEGEEFPEKCNWLIHEMKHCGEYIEKKEK